MPPLTLTLNVEIAVIKVMQPVAAQFTAVASPDESIVATSASLDCQVTLEPVNSWVVGLAVKVRIAMNCAVSPNAFNV
jgi:hypothetical protein